MKTLVFLLLLAVSGVASADDGLHMQVGIGVHDPAYDWHIPTRNVVSSEDRNDFYGSNPLGIVRLSWTKGRWSVGYEHVSSIPNTHDDHGLNVVYVTAQIF